jgi:hypothetical protein
LREPILSSFLPGAESPGGTVFSFLKKRPRRPANLLYWSIPNPVQTS